MIKLLIKVVYRYVINKYDKANDSGRHYFGLSIVLNFKIWDGSHKHTGTTVEAVVNHMWKFIFRVSSIWNVYRQSLTECHNLKCMIFLKKLLNYNFYWKKTV